MKISSTKKAAILATVLGGFVLGQSAEAANLGVITASDYVTSHMGALQGSYIHSDDIKAVKSVISGLNGDPAVYNTVDPITGKSSLYIRQYTYSNVNLQNSFAFDAQGNWNDRAAGSVSEATNAHDVARYNDFVYVASYDEGTVGVAEIVNNDGTKVISDKTAFTRDLKADLLRFGSEEVKEVLSDSKAALHGEGVVIIDGNLYVIANCNPQGGYTPYSPSYLIKYVIKEDGRLSYDGYTTMGKNTDSVALNVYNNYMLATAIGGYQYYGAENSNADTSIDVVTLNPENKRFMDTRQITLPENLLQVRDGKTIPKSEFRSLKVLPNGTAYVMTYNIGKAGKNVDVTVYQTTVSNLLSSKPQNWKEVYKQEAAPGWFGRLDAEYNTKRLWVQVGNKLHIYTDGATDPKVFGTDSFAANSMYEELYTWDIIGTDVIPEGNLVKLNVVNNVAANDVKTNKKAVKWDNATVTNVNQRLENVSGQVMIENNDKPLIHLDGNVEGNKTNNVLAGIYAEGVNTSVVSNKGLQIQVQNNIASPVGIYAGNGGSVKYYGSSSDLNIITKTMDGGNTLTNAVWLDPSKNGSEAITLQSASTNITMEGGYGGNGVAIQKTDRWGENSKASTQGGKITITGDLNIKGKDNATWGIEGNPTNVISRFNNAGILVDVNNSSVTVGGNVDMDVYGNGVTVTGDNSTVTIEKGGSITVPQGTNYGYYALAAYDGTINMNANAGDNTVKLNGDIFVTSEGTVNLGLANEYSYLKGIIDNGGTANVTLKNGAVWTNEANNTRYYQDNEDKGTDDQRSHVTKLTGGTSFDDAGTIIQTANSKLLYIDNLEGAVKVNFTGQDVTDTNPETKLNNGVTIDKAVEGSQIALFTTNAGIKTDDEESVNAVLNALANKLYYTAYVTGERNLTGVAVGMDEGLTASTVTKQANIRFIETTGQGSLSGSASDGTGINPDTGKEEKPDEDEGGSDVEDKPEVGDGGVLSQEFTPVAHPNNSTIATNVPSWDNEPTVEAIDVTALTSNLKPDKDAIIGVSNNVKANVGDGILAATYAVNNSKRRTITGTDSLKIQAESDVFKPVAIYSSGTGRTTFKVNKLDIVTKTNNDDMRTNAIWMESNGGKVQEEIYLNADVNIHMIGGYGGNGVAITKSDDYTTAAYDQKIYFYKNLNIKGADVNGNTDWGIGANKLNALGKENNAGILVSGVDNGWVHIAGNANIDVYGNGVTVDANKGKVDLGNGGKITVPKGTDYAYYTLAAYKGTINMKSGDVQLDGDILAARGGSINLGLTTANSYLKGIANNGGTINLTLKNGAEWNNEAQNERYKFDNQEVIGDGRSIINTLNGGSSLGDAGNIFQTENSGNLFVDNLSGTIKVTYKDCNANDPTEIYGGNVTINKANANSQIGLYTTNNGVNEENVDKVLNALANKLYYNAYVNGYDNLKGIVGILEGLNSSSVTKQADIKFISTTGQGSLSGNEADGTGANQDDYIANGGHGVIVDGGVVNSSSNITVLTDTQNKRNFYALAAYDGTINYNWCEPNNVFSVPTNKNITGNLLVDSETAAIKMALNGSNSELKGAVINNEGGTAWLFLTDGAKWTNVSNNTNEIGAVSHLSKLDAYYNNNCNSVAKIIQTPTSGDIIIDEFGGGGSISGNQTVYAGNLKVEYELDENSPTVIKGGSIVIEDSFKGSKLTVYTPYSNAVTKDNLWSVFNSLANKIYYHGAKYLIDQTTGEVLLDENGNPKQQDGDGSLDAYVQMGEGLTASSVAAELTAKGILKDGAVSEDIDDIEYTGGSLNADIKWNGTTGQGSLTGNLENGTGYYESNTGSDAFMNAKGAYTQPIYGVLEKDGKWMGKGITTGDGVYNFTDAVTVFETNNKKIDGGAWHTAVGVAISAHGDLGNRDKEYKTVVNMNNNDLVITNTTTGSGASISAIDGGKVVINDPGNIIINEKGHGPTAGIFANSGGEVYIDNADGGVVTIRTSAGGGGGPESGYGTSGAGIKTMNGVSDVRSYVTITGMVDIVADLNTCNNEAISAVASTVEVGGGNLQAINGAWAAIRAYGEFVSDNAAIVNVNVLKDSAGNITGAGNNKTTIFGDFVTNGGMGTLGYITVGLNGEDSYWTGNYADTRGYGVTKGQEGNVTVLMKNGATWTGFSDGEMNVTMEGEGTTWLGYNVAERQADAMGNTNGGLVLTLKDGAVWQNAITTEQKYNDTVQDAKVYDFNGDGGFIDMTGNKTFIGKNSASHADGSNGVSFKNTSIIFNDTPQETGNLVITNYSGDTTVIYRHDTTDVTNILGGTTTIKKASAGSNITLSTDSTGIDMTSTSQVSEVLDNLANKLYYTNYADEVLDGEGNNIGGERNLQGKVQIAEGLTTSSVGKYVGDIAFSTADGQGSLKAGSLSKPVDPSVPPSGDEDDEKPEDKPVVPEVKPEQKPVVEEEIKGAITGDSLTDTTDENPYKDLIGKDDKDNDVIDFSKLDKEDSKVDIVKIESEEEGGKNSVIAAAPSKPVIIDVAGKDLAVNGSATSEALGIQAIGGDVTIKDAGYVTITANAGETGSASAIYAKGGDVTIENSDTVKLIAKGNANDAVLHADTNSNVNIKGKVEITDTNGKVAVEVAKGSTVALGGGVIDAGKEGTAIVVTGDDSKVVANTDDKGESKKNGLKIKGNIQIGEVPASTFNLRRSIMLLASGNKPYGEFTFDGVEDTWEGDYIGANDATLVLALKNGATWTGAKESNGNLDLTIETNGTWKNTSDNATTVTTLSGEGGFVEMSEAENADITVNKYSGSTTFLYNNAYGKDVEDDKLIKGGDVTIVAVDTTNAANSNVTLRTNSIGTSDKDEVERVLNALAQKLAYTANDGKLNGTVQIMEGMTGSSVTREGLIKFDATSGQGSLDASKDVTIDYKGDYIYGDSETAMMKGAKSAMASTVMMWRSESNDLLQRMGDVRLATEESGVWAKYYGGKYEMDAQNTNFSTNYKAYQVGYDKAVGNGWNVGVAVSHNEGDSRYDRGGEGEMTVTSLSVYGNKDYGDGRYLGLILKGSQLKNEYEVFNNDGYKLEGDFKTWGTSISAEYGKRIEKGNGFYFDPSVELTVGHVQGKDYTATSDMLAAYGKTATMQVEQDDFNSIIGRIGFGVGQRTERASYYAKLALAHEFGGDFDTNYTAEETKGTSISFGDTWYEMQLGGTAKLSDNSLLYATYERSFGGDVTEKWRVDAGLRVTF